MLRFHHNALNVRALRQEVIASNIANADTPGYKARDVDFASVMRGANAARSAESGLARTSPRHLGAPGGFANDPRVQYRSELQPSLDANTVSMDVERAHFADNAVRYEANLMFISGQLKGLLSAIQG